MEESDKEESFEKPEKINFFKRILNSFKKDNLLPSGNEIKIQKTNMSIDSMMRWGAFRARTAELATSVIDKTSEFFSSLAGKSADKNGEPTNSLKPEVIGQNTQSKDNTVSVDDTIKQNTNERQTIIPTIVGNTHSKEAATQEVNNDIEVGEIEIDDIEKEDIPEISLSENDSVVVVDLNVNTIPEKESTNKKDSPSIDDGR